MGEVLSLIGLGLAVPGVIEHVIKAGSKIEQRVSTARHIEAYLTRYRAIGTSLSRGSLSAQLEIVAAACQNSTLPIEFKLQLDSSFDKIIDCLVHAEKDLNAAESSLTKGRVRLLFGRQLGFECKVQELERQQDVFMTLASLVHIQQSIPPSSFLANRIKLLHESQNESGTNLLRNSTITIARYDAGRGVLKNVIVEHRPYTDHSKPGLEEDLKSLTMRLCRDGTIQSVPRCLGYRKNPFKEAYEIMFEIPEHPSRRALADMLACDSMPSLDHRVTLCKLLTQAVSDVHSIGLVHKRIRPRSILVVGQYDRQVSSQLLYLTDWTLVRAVEQASHFEGDADWQHAIYQHPSRQLLQAESKYSIKHDCYSLGICMLEILLWKPLVVSSDPNAEDSPKQISEHYQERAIALGDQGVPAKYRGNTRAMTGKPSVVRRVMTDLCRTEVPACAGNKLTEVIMRCLGCLDDATTSAVQTSSDDDLESGLNYVPDVVVALSSISI